jgi:hypothetical protein
MAEKKQQLAVSAKEIKSLPADALVSTNSVITGGGSSGEGSGISLGGAAEGALKLFWVALEW